MQRSLLFAGAIALSGCTSLENALLGEPADTTPNLPSTPEGWAQKSDVEAAQSENWLAQFNDPALVEIIEEALTANPRILESEARVRVAKQNSRAVFGRSLPSANYSFSNGYATQFASTALGGGVVVDGRFNQPTYDQRVDLQWELDLWGRVRANNRAARSDFFATEADLAAARLSLGGEAAVAWIDLNAALEQERVAEETMAARKRVVDLTERRFERGLSTALDVRTARTELAQADAQIALQGQTRENAARRLEVLLGRYPSTEIEAPAELPVLDGIRTISDPTVLLSRRPDIAAAEARLEAAGYRAEVARLAMLPSFNATSTISNSSSIEFADILDPERISANIFGALTQNIWNGGALKADKRGAYARVEELSATYANAVLTAWREVEDALANDRYLAIQLEAQKRALEEARLAEDLALRQYQNGLVDIFNLLQSQTTRLNAESSYINVSAQRVTNRIDYHLALGGGGPLGPEAEDEQIINATQNSAQSSESKAP
ncbi:MAG: efflux transporter outer membrane subunit [Pseudomonadota bacterium]